jgi:RNA polymerase sigma factor (sigma-70 family)
MRRRNIRIAGRDWAHLTPRVQAELYEAIAALGPLPQVPTPRRELELLMIVHSEAVEFDRLSARRELQDGNLRLVCEIVPIFCGRGAAPADLIHEGWIGLDWGIQKWDPAKINPKNQRPYRLTSYVAWWLRRAMQHGLRRKGSIFQANGHSFLELSDLEHDPLAPPEDRAVDPLHVDLARALDLLPRTTAEILRRRHAAAPERHEQIAADMKIEVRLVRRIEAAGLKQLRQHLQPRGATP